MSETLTPQGQPREETGESPDCMGNCWLGHAWSQWKDGGSGNIFYEGKIIGQFVLQSKRCLKCNKIQLRYAEVTT